jgi:hypothetical protein
VSNQVRLLFLDWSKNTSWHRVSLWLNAGVPATEVARRAGHGVAVLLKIYAHCIDGQATAANQRITEALGIRDDEPDPSDEDDDDTEQAS